MHRCVRDNDPICPGDLVRFTDSGQPLCVDCGGGGLTNEAAPLSTSVHARWWITRCWHNRALLDDYWDAAQRISPSTRRCGTRKGCVARAAHPQAPTAEGEQATRTEGPLR
jgi:hypothetical protein